MNLQTDLSPTTYVFNLTHQVKIFEIKTLISKTKVISSHGFVGKEKIILKTIIWLLNGHYTSCLSNINSILISKFDAGSIKIEKAKKWNIRIVNGCWLMELYLGNVYAMSNNGLNTSSATTNDAKKGESSISAARYANLIVTNHFAYDSLLVAEFMQSWQELIKLPVHVIREAQVNRPLKDLNNGEPTAKRFNRPVSPSGKDDCVIIDAKIPRK
jgi:hypothetical protein